MEINDANMTFECSIKESKEIIKAIEINQMPLPAINLYRNVATNRVKIYFSYSNENEFSEMFKKVAELRHYGHIESVIHWD